MKSNINVAIILSMILVYVGCKSNPMAPTVVASENWKVVMNNDTTNHADQTFQKKSDGSIAVSSTWYFYHDTLQCKFSNGKATVSDTTISFAAQGTATSLSAPAGYQECGFTMTTSGSAYNGTSSGTFNIAFSRSGWASGLSGTFAAERESGSGVTK